MASVEHCKGVNGLEKVILRGVQGSSVQVYLYGGQVASWKNELGEELLFLSSKFSNHGPLESHGFARNRYEFRLRITLGSGRDLMLTSGIRNTNTDWKPFSFTFSYHTHFAGTDICEVQVEGLETSDYLDNQKNKERFTEQGDAITFESEIDRVYLSTPTRLQSWTTSGKEHLYYGRMDCQMLARETMEDNFASAILYDVKCAFVAGS